MVVQLMECADALQVLDLKVSFRAIEKITLPVFKGNVLRSALGRSLKDVLCVAKGRRECTGCMLEGLCTYRKLFPSQSTHPEFKGSSMPYIASFSDITPREIDIGYSFSIDLRLFGPAVRNYPYFFFSLERMASLGLGNRNNEGKRGRAVLTDIYEISPVGAESCIFSRSGKSPLPDPVGRSLMDYITPEIHPERIFLATLSPLRLKFRNSFDVTGDFHILLRSCLRRYESLCLLAFGKKPVIPWEELLERAFDIENLSENIRWVDHHRYSSRQHTGMSLGGIEGRLDYRGDLGSLLPYLQMGEVLGIGKGISFGFGRFLIEAAF